MPSFNIFKNFGGPKAPPSRPVPIAKDFAYPQQSILSQVGPATVTAHSRSGSMPPEIIQSEPIANSSLGRRGTLKKKAKRRPDLAEEASPGVWSRPSSTARDDILPGPPPIAIHQSSGYQPTDGSIYPGKYPHAFEDHHQQRFQYNTTMDSGVPPPNGMQDYENGIHSAIYPEPSPPRGGMHHEHKGRRHGRPRHRHHRHHYQPPQEYEPSYPAQPIYPHGYSPYEDENEGPDHSRSRSRSRSFTPIPSVYREPDSMELEDSYADPMIQESHMRGPGSNRRLSHGPEGLGHEFDGRGPPQAPTPAMIDWIPRAAERQQTDEESSPRIHDPEGTLVGDAEPQIITPPVESENPLRTNVYHTRQPDFDPDMARQRRAHAHENRYRDQGAPKEQRKKAYMYNDYHHTEKMKPKAHGRRTPEESDSEPEEYRYIVPSGVHVVFRDHDGHAIARIGHPGPVSGGRHHRDMTPFTVQDEHGNILYRSRDSNSGRSRDDRYLRSGNPRPPRPAKVIMIDEHGNQIPLKIGESQSSRSHHSRGSHSHRSHHSHHSQHLHHSHPSQPSEYSDPSHYSHPSHHPPQSSQHSHSSGRRRGHY